MPTPADAPQHDDETPPKPAGGDRPLKIALVSDCYVPRLGGIEMQVHDLARHLVAAGHDVVVITPTPGPEVTDGVRAIRVDVPLLPFDVPYRRSTFTQLADVLRREHVDVAHFHGGIISPYAFVGAANAQDEGIPTVVTTHCLWSYATPLFRLANTRYHWTEWPVVFSAVSDVAAAPIYRIANHVLDVEILPNGIENDTWTVQPAPRDASVVTIVAVMRLAPRKRPLHLLKMFKRVHDDAPAGTTVRLVIIGEGPERPKLEKYIAEHGLGDVVDLAGRRSRDDIREFFAHADVFVAPANLESFGIAALEARCAGLPVVAKARTGIREFVSHGQEGFLVEDDDDMVAHLVRLVRDPALRNQIARHNRETPSSVDWSVVADLNVDAYHHAIALMGEDQARRTG